MWVYIQGGGYAHNSNANYNGSDVVEGPGYHHNGTHLVTNSGHKLVFVNFNYRVGALGFLASEKVKKNGDLNAGLLDQRKLLHWVQNNIAKVWRFQFLYTSVDINASRLVLTVELLDSSVVILLML